MIEVSKPNSTGMIEARFSGHIVRADYEDVLIPAIEAATADHERLRALVVFDDSFTGYDVSAAWADAKLGLSHWSGFDRVALATDVGWIKATARTFGVMAPCPVGVFALAEAEDARRWLRESLGAVHMNKLDNGALQVQLLGQLDPAEIENAEGDLNARIREMDDFRLLLDLREFDGWQGLSALTAHFSLVREHAPLAQKVAVVGHKTWHRLAQRVMGRFLNAETRFFEADDYADATQWIGAT